MCTCIYMYIHPPSMNQTNIFFPLICSRHEDLFWLMIGLTPFAQISRKLQGLPSTKYHETKQGVTYVTRR